MAHFRWLSRLSSWWSFRWCQFFSWATVHPSQKFCFPNNLYSPWSGQWSPCCISRVFLAFQETRQTKTLLLENSDNSLKSRIKTNLSTSLVTTAIKTNDIPIPLAWCRFCYGGRWVNCISLFLLCWIIVIHLPSQDRQSSLLGIKTVGQKWI